MKLKKVFSCHLEVHSLMFLAEKAEGSSCSICNLDSHMHEAHGRFNHAWNFTFQYYINFSIRNNTGKNFTIHSSLFPQKPKSVAISTLKKKNNQSKGFSLVIFIFHPFSILMSRQTFKNQEQKRNNQLNKMKFKNPS